MTSTKSRENSKAADTKKPVRRAAPRSVSRAPEEVFLEQFQKTYDGEVSQAYGLGPWLKKNQDRLGSLSAICQTLKERYGEAVRFFLSPESDSSSAPVLLAVCLRYFDLDLLDVLDEIHTAHQKVLAEFEPMLVIAPNFGQEEKAS
ncbi:MAG: hypothetical protein ACAI44_18120 [Candidatus Sericytochromatia bacterium]